MVSLQFWKLFFTSFQKFPNLPTDLANNLVNAVIEKTTTLSTADISVNIVVDFIELLVTNFINDNDVTLFVRSTLRLCLRRPSYFSSYLITVLVQHSGFSSSLQAKLLSFVELMKDNSFCIDTEKDNDRSFLALQDEAQRSSETCFDDKMVKERSNHNTENSIDMRSWHLANDMDWTAIPLGGTICKKTSETTDHASVFSLNLPIHHSHANRTMQPALRQPFCEKNTEDATDNNMNMGTVVDSDNDHLSNDETAHVTDHSTEGLEIEQSIIADESNHSDDMLMTGIVIF